jgi:hypothetical protein
VLRLLGGFNCVTVLWHIDPLVGNDRKRNETTAIAMQQLRKYAKVMVPLLGSGPLITMKILL